MNVDALVASLTHDYDDACVCIGCQGMRAERRHARRQAHRDGQAAAQKVTRYGYKLIDAKSKDRDNIVVSRAGVAYERIDHKDADGNPTGKSTIRRIGVARVIGKNAIQVIPGQRVRGKAARKAEKRARQARREQDAHRRRAIEAALLARQAP